ncbi:organic cation/carnitine transporter 7-like [Coccinella septempunctata]|uniref:organic cation/carnitine transporter 7-like n=1 Tax=Coccinella septempunctata TaxID=41139 RepID=UPI001D06223D|nr:organic cation/carnitine transporter 7-like [Coccinella septempunctata]XP_044756915.1 organic cation/carnitine transporter 7-like [Coccinella septempunctata]
MGASDIHRKSASAEESVEFDEALVLTGYGRFHFESLAACALGIVIVGFQNGITSYIFPAAQCELDLASSQLGFLNVAFLVGGMCSCFFWGSLADALGRKYVLITSLLLDCVVMIVLTVSNHVMCLTICRFLNGFFAGAPGSVLLSYLGEFQPPKLRSGIICGAGLFFTSSWLLLPILAWFILPLNIHITIGSWFIITPWRLYLIFVAIQEGVLGLWFLRLPESPKYLLAIGKKKEALDILRKMFVLNKGKSPEEYPVKSLYCPSANNDVLAGKVGCIGKASRILRDMSAQMKSLFKTPLLFITILSCTIMFTNMFGAFGLGLWLPELFIRFKQYAVLHPNETVTLDKLALLSVATNKTCDSTFDLSVIQNTVVMGLTSLVTSVFCGYISTKVSIKTIPFVCMLLGGLASASIYWLRSATQNLIVASVFQATMIVANMSLSGVVVELFPTSVGATAICLAMFMGRMGAMTSNMVFGLLMDEHCEIPIFAVAVNVLLGALLCWVIPVNQSEEKIDKNSYVAGKTVEISLVTLPKNECNPGA